MAPPRRLLRWERHAAAAASLPNRLAWRNPGSAITRHAVHRCARGTSLDNRGGICRQRGAENTEVRVLHAASRCDAGPGGAGEANPGPPPLLRARHHARGEGFLGHGLVRWPSSRCTQARLKDQKRATTTGNSKSRAHVSLPSVLSTLYAQTGGQTKEIW